MISIILPLTLLFTSTTICAQNYVTVSTSYGTIQGQRVDYGNDRNQLYFGQADVFLGVPYAQAPTGTLRFKAPVQLSSSNQIYDATYYRPKCPQLYAGDYVNEDCLYLNIYAPVIANQSNAAAVMVFIDGANGFGQGGWDSTTQKGMVRNLVSRGVICVTIQYRLGALGFFTTNTQEFPPNLGMLDQVQALRWINSEISNFGGNPNKITLCGQGFGGCAVSAHTLSPLSQNLFQQAIIQSGPLLSCYSPCLSYQTSAQTTQSGPTATTQTQSLQYEPGLTYAPIEQPQPSRNPYEQGGSTDYQYQTSTTAGNQYQGGTSPGTYYSPTTQAPPISMYDDASPSQILAQELCNVTSEQWRTGQVGDLSRCLHNYTVDVFIKTEGAKKAMWMIVRDDTFLPDTIQNLAIRRPPIPIIIGTVQDEDADYAFKLVADGQVNQSEGQLYTNWMMDFAKRNRLNASTAAQISNIISQNYNISTGGAQFDMSSASQQYGGSQYGGTTQQTYQPYQQTTYGHANENGYGDTEGYGSTQGGVMYDQSTTSSSGLVGQGYTTQAPRYDNQQGGNTGGYGSVDNGYNTQAPEYGNQPGGYNYQSGGFQNVGMIYNQSSSGYSISNYGYGAQPIGYGTPTASRYEYGPSTGYPTQGALGSQTYAYSNQNSGYTIQSSACMGCTKQNVGNNNQNYGYPTQQGGYSQGNNQYQNVAPARDQTPYGYGQNAGYNYAPTTVTNPQTVQALKTISQLQSDSGIVSQTASEIDTFMQNGNQYVMIYQFTHVTDLGRQNLPNLGTWKPVCKGQDMVFLLMSETIWSSGSPTQEDRRTADQMGDRWTQFAKEGQVPGWQPSNPQTYNYCALNYQPTIQVGYAQQARTVFNNQVYPIVQQAQSSSVLYDTTNTRQFLPPGFNIMSNPVQVNYSSSGSNSSTLHLSFQIKNVPWK